MEHDPFVRYRVVAFMTWGSLLFFGAAALALLISAMQALNAPHAAILAAASDSWAMVLENQDRILWWVRVGFVLEALVGAATVIGAVLLLKRVAWAPLLLEILTWCVPGVYLVVAMTAEPWIHHHVDLVSNRREALLWYASFHSSIAKWLIVASIGAGVLLMFLRRERLEARQRELMTA